MALYEMAFSRELKLTVFAGVRSNQISTCTKFRDTRRLCFKTAMNQDCGFYILLVSVFVLFSLQIVLADDTELYKNNEEKRFAAFNDFSNPETPYSKQYWFYPHTSQGFLKTLLRYLALNEQSYRNTVKRQRTFGFVGTRGKRGDTFDGLKDFVRKLQDEINRRKYGSMLLDNSLDNSQNGYNKLELKLDQ
ncbi:hypothetical protein LOTGIDRAFT_166767 [Lottia gigantea]|uniref:Uncharacterized protein n=1 Tax=Lottia gigantea TaxID=225164 RepID=V3Z7E2_LOTGI|nr:hypothetical protein LOTGIDRAFT_166767 [Lottia gigantea]ESO86763.1 hypothetical protein LOTGIDRAFT_166767 [Lottia gigantea]